MYELINFKYTLKQGFLWFWGSQTLGASWGKVHPKVIIFHIIYSLSGCLQTFMTFWFLWNSKEERRCLVFWCFLVHIIHSLEPIDLQCIVENVLQNMIFFSHEKKVIQIWSDMRVNKCWKHSFLYELFKCQYQHLPNANIRNNLCINPGKSS